MNALTELQLKCVFLNLLLSTAISYNNKSRGVIWPQGCAHDYTKFANYCYERKDKVTFPFECAYKDIAPLAEYENIFLNLVSALGEKPWINLRQNADYGYYQWLEIGDNYGTLFEEAINYNGECVVLSGFDYVTETCTSKYVGLCVYPFKRNIKNYCDIYNEICGTNSNCHCQEDRKGFYCESECSETSQQSECSACEQKFREYPLPEIALTLQNNDILVTVTNALKLYYITNKNVIYCYTNVYEPSTTSIRYRFKDTEVKTSKTKEDTIIYEIQTKKLGPGHYWCEGFLYPNMEIVQSNTIIAGANYGLNFVLNVTVELTASHKFLPYNIHTKTQETISQYLDQSKILSVRLVELSKLYGGQNSKIDIVFHISTKTSVDQTNEVSEDITQSLASLDKHAEILSYSLSSSEVCLSETTKIDDVDVTWPTVTIGRTTTPTTIVLQPDGAPLTRTCMGCFKYGSYWSEIIGEADSDQDISETTGSLHDLLTSNISAREKNKLLHATLLATETFIPYDVHLISRIFEQIATSQEEYDFDILTDNLNIVTKIDRDVLSESQHTLNATDSLLYTFDVALGTVSSERIETENLIVQVVNMRNEDIVGLALYEEHGEITTVALDQSMSLENIERKNLVFATRIPSELLIQILEVTDFNANTSLVIAVYLNDALFNDNSTKASVSAILSMFVVGFESALLEPPIPIIFEQSTSSANENHCGYWNYGINELWASFFGHWNVDKNAKFDANTKTCSFNHMTHFTLLVGAQEDAVTNYLSTIGGALSLISVFFIFLTAAISKAWRESAGTKILLNFSAAIALQMILLIVLSLITPEEYVMVCIALGILLHYIVISQFCWALIISYLQYRKFVQVLVNEPSHIVTKSCVFAWGTALIPVLISACTDVHNYHFNNVCYPSRKYLHIGLYFPVILIILANVVIFLLIFWSVLYKKTTAFGAKKNLTVLRVKLGVILFFLMGFSWIFGLLGSFLDSSFLLYVFCFTNAIQGLVLYMYFILWNKGTRRLWVRQFKKVTNHRSERDENKTSTTSQSVSHNKKY